MFFRDQGARVLAQMQPRSRSCGVSHDASSRTTRNESIKKAGPNGRWTATVGVYAVGQGADRGIGPLTIGVSGQAMKRRVLVMGVMRRASETLEGDGHSGRCLAAMDASTNVAGVSSCERQDGVPQPDAKR